MKVTISELRSMIREALEETTMETVGQEEKENAGSPGQNVLGGDQGEGAVREGAWGELEEAWDELEEAAGLQEAADKKEKKPAKKVKKEEKKEDKKAFSLSASQLKAVKKLDADDFEKCLQLMARGIPVQAALKMCHAKED